MKHVHSLSKRFTSILKPFGIAALSIILLAALKPAPAKAGELTLYGGLAKEPVPLYEETDAAWFGPAFGMSFSGSAMESPLHVGLDFRYQQIEDTRTSFFGESTYRYTMMSIAPILKLRSTPSEMPHFPVIEMSLAAGAMRYGIDFVEGTLGDGEPGEDEVRWYPILRPGGALKLPISEMVRVSVGVDATFFVNKPDDRMPVDHTEAMVGLEFAF